MPSQGTAHCELNVCHRTPLCHFFGMLCDGFVGQTVSLFSSKGGCHIQLVQFNLLSCHNGGEMTRCRCLPHLSRLTARALPGGFLTKTTIALTAVMTDWDRRFTRVVYLPNMPDMCIHARPALPLPSASTPVSVLECSCQYLQHQPWFNSRPW